MEIPGKETYPLREMPKSAQTVSALPSFTHIISIFLFPRALSVLSTTKKKYYQTAVTSSKVKFGALEMMPKESQTTAAFCGEETELGRRICAETLLKSPRLDNENNNSHLEGLF